MQILCTFNLTKAVHGSQRHDWATELNWKQYNSVFLQIELFLDFHLSEICKKLRENCGLVLRVLKCFLIEKDAWAWFLRRCAVLFAVFSVCCGSSCSKAGSAAASVCVTSLPHAWRCWSITDRNYGFQVLQTRKIILHVWKSGFCNCCIRCLIYMSNKLT